MRTTTRRVIALLVAGTAALSGCGTGSKAVDSQVRRSAAAACLQGITAIKDPAARRSAAQACRAVGSGNSRQLTDAAKKAAREACRIASAKIPDATARAAAKAACPSVK